MSGIFNFFVFVVCWRFCIKVIVLIQIQISICVILLIVCYISRKDGTIIYLFLYIPPIHEFYWVKWYLSVSLICFSNSSVRLFICESKEKCVSELSVFLFYLFLFLFYFYFKSISSLFLSIRKSCIQLGEPNSNQQEKKEHTHENKTKRKFLNAIENL